MTVRTVGWIGRFFYRPDLSWRGKTQTLFAKLDNFELNSRNKVDFDPLFVDGVKQVLQELTALREEMPSGDWIDNEELLQSLEGLEKQLQKRLADQSYYKTISKVKARVKQVANCTSRAFNIAKPVVKGIYKYVAKPLLNRASHLASRQNAHIAYMYAREKVLDVRDLIRDKLVRAPVPQLQAPVQPPPILRLEAEAARILAGMAQGGAPVEDEPRLAIEPDALNELARVAGLLRPEVDL